MKRFSIFILFIVLTASPQLVARSQIMTCEFILSEMGILQWKVQWPSDLVYPRRPLLYHRMLSVVIGHDDVMSIHSGTKVKNAIRFLATQKSLSMSELVGLWELAIRVIRDGDSNWKALRAVGSDGSVLFFGPYGPALVFRPDGRIFRGALDYPLKMGEVWQANVSGWTEIVSSPAPTSK